MVRRKQSPSRANKSKRETIKVFDNVQYGIAYMDKKLYKTIKLLQISTKLLIPKLPFARLVREIMMELLPNPYEFRIQSKALQALQESSELYLTTFFEDSYLCTLHAKRKTLQVTDMQLCRRIRGRNDIINR